MKNKIQYLVALGERLKSSDEFQEKVQSAVKKNSWFIPEFVSYAVDAIAREMLNETKLNKWLSRYELKPVNKTVGLIFAGNIPLVGFHDFISCYIADCRMKIKLSSKDDELFPALLNILFSMDKELSGKIELVDKLKDFDAVIATGSNNTNRYFEYYFRNYPKLLRRNRNCVAILTGKETQDDLGKLADDIFLYFGFGCRNVSKIYLPVGYHLTTLFPHFSQYQWLHQHNKYMNNYDYNRTLLMLNKTPHLTNDFVTLTENSSIPSPISVIHYEYWQDETTLTTHLKENSENIQCVVCGNEVSDVLKTSDTHTVAFGQSKRPELWDYADGVDTMRFLLGL